MMAWITPVTDRTKADTDAKNLKGQLIANDLNRIEENCKYLAEQLNAYGYYTSLTFKTNWVVTDFPTKEHLDRIRSNIETILAAYSTMQGSPTMDWVDYFSYTDANSLEQNLANIKILLERMIVGFCYCGTFYSGQEVILP